VRTPLPAAGHESPTRRAGPVLNVAHRGASDEVAENTLSAIRRAVDLGADMVEVDVHRSRDGALVLMHDTTLVRTTNARQLFPRRAPWRVSDFSYDELARLDAGSWRSPAFSGERVPTLAEAVDVIRRSSAGLLLELKAPVLYPGIVTDVVTCLRDIPGYVGSATAAGRLVVQSFDVAAMKDHKTQAPVIPVGLLGVHARANLPVLATWADQVNPSHLAVDRGYVELVHQLGMSCCVWTVNRGASMRRALRMGVDGVITNRPELFGRIRGSAAFPLRAGSRSSWSPTR
jgi:glycerophosphoryl diester phosphodiesterase